MLGTDYTFKGIASVAFFSIKLKSSGNTIKLRICHSINHGLDTSPKVYCWQLSLENMIFGECFRLKPKCWVSNPAFHTS